jgi:hypothetical protein
VDHHEVDAPHDGDGDGEQGVAAGHGDDRRTARA